MSVLKVPALVILLAALSGCGHKTETESPAPKEELPKPVVYFHVDPATAATLAGKVSYAGKRPAQAAISMDAEASCQGLHKGKRVYDESIVLGKDGAVANVFIYVQAGLEGKKFEPAKEAVHLDQRGCLFAPRVVGVRAGQTIAVKNSDPVSHNIHPMPKDNRDWNEQQSPQSPDLERHFARMEVMIPVKCNIHNWMRSYIGVVEHPYFAVTGPDGKFEIKDLPPGTYTIAAWHEKFGEITQQVTLEKSASRGVSFEYTEIKP